VHLHAIIRADGPDEEMPAVTSDQLVLACLRAARSVSVQKSRGDVTWGSQVDVQALDREVGQAKRIASYVAKYATKSTDENGALDRPIRTQEDLELRQLSPHLRRMVETAWRLGDDPELDHLHLRRYTHTLGYGGQFLTKSMRYSSTFAALRAQRSAWREARRHRGVAPPEQTATARAFNADWEVVGIGWANPGEARFAEGRWHERLEEMRLANEDRYFTK
jgi:hypothetical protein